MYRCAQSIHMCHGQYSWLLGWWMEYTNTYAANKSPPLCVMGCDVIWNIQRKLKTFTVSIHFSLPFNFSCFLFPLFIKNDRQLYYINKYKYPYPYLLHTLRPITSTYIPHFARTHTHHARTYHFTFSRFAIRNVHLAADTSSSDPTPFQEQNNF